MLSINFKLSFGIFQSISFLLGAPLFCFVFKECLCFSIADGYVTLRTGYINVIKICLLPSLSRFIRLTLPFPAAFSCRSFFLFLFSYFFVGSFKLEKFLPDFCFTFFIFSTGHALRVSCPWCCCCFCCYCCCCCSWCQSVICVAPKRCQFQLQLHSQLHPQQQLSWPAG